MNYSVQSKQSCFELNLEEKNIHKNIDYRLKKVFFEKNIVFFF